LLEDRCTHITLKKACIHMQNTVKLIIVFDRD